MDITKVKVLNPPWTMGSNMSKPGQAQLIKETGLKIPPTCITNDEQFLQQFRQTHKLVIFKSISGIRSIVHELKATNEKMINKIKWLPTQFQQKLEGVNIRVHVVGDVLFATKIETEVTDYRYAQRENKTATPEAFELPKKIAQYCFALSKKLGLTLCGIDLFLTGKGEYYCFEVNPSPGYSYFQSNTGQNISGAIVNWLCYGTAK
jgi:glutathione synthase/RimK-type ligase-like ATP-grasp enzyme